MARSIFPFWRSALAVCAAALLAVLAGCGAGKDDPLSSPPPELMVYGAASLTDALQEAGEAFAQEHRVEMVYNFAASGALARQIMASSQADVFISANKQWMDAVAKDGDLRVETRTVLLKNRLVVIAHPAASFTMDASDDLCGLDFRFLAVGDPAYVPAGRYAREWLEGVECGNGSAWQAVQERISPAPDVRAALGQVEASRDVVGIVYQTDAEAAKDRVQVLYPVPESEAPAVEYPAAVLADAPEAELAMQFLAFLKSKRGREIFSRHGFSQP